MAYTITPATGYIKYYNGSTWVNATMKYYNGSTWVNATMKYYNGSTWATGVVRHWNGAAWVPAPSAISINAITGTVDWTAQTTISSSPSSVLICGWIRNPDFNNSVWPYSRGNLNFVSLFGGTTNNDSWSIQSIVCNSSAAAAEDTNATFNANTMLFATDALTWIDDYSYYFQDGHTTTQIMDWIFCAIQLTISGTSIIVRQWIRFGLTGSTLAIIESTITQAEIRTATGNAVWAAGILNRIDVGVDRSSLVTRVRVYNTSTIPTQAQLDTIAEMSALDTTSDFAGVLWADWPYEWAGGAAVLTDRSGNARTLSLVAGQTLADGGLGPSFV